jgi:hypothetical protein
MTREAVEAGFVRFVDDVVDETVAEFSVARALRRGVRGPGGQLADRLVKNSGALRRRVVEPELDAYRARARRQFEAVLDAVESDEPFEAHADAVLRADSYWEAVRPDLPATRRDRVRETLLDRNRALGEAVRPVVDAPADDFWTATTDALTLAEATTLVESSFAFTDPLVAHRDAFVFETAFDPADVLGGVGGLLAGGLPTVEVEFTDEAVRAMCRAEEVVIARTVREVRRRFAAA